MKKFIASIILLIVTTITFAQNETTTDSSVETENIKVEILTNETVAVSKTMRAKVIRLNHKKSNNIISIKAYRKSLQIKVKTKKLC